MWKVLGLMLYSFFPLSERQMELYLFLIEIKDFQVDEWLQKVWIQDNKTIHHDSIRETASSAENYSLGPKT